MGAVIHRRRLLAVAIAAVLAPRAAPAQPARRVARIGIIATSAAVNPGSGGTPADRTPPAALLRGLSDLGYVHGRDFVTEARSSEGVVARIPAIVAELVGLKVDVIVAPGPALPALRDARTTIPIVMAGSGADPVKAGFVASLARPGGAFTGMSLLSSELYKKRLELLIEIVPRVSRIAVLRGPGSESDWQETEAAAPLLQKKFLSLEVKSANDIERAFQTAREWHADALLVMAGALLDREARQVVARAAAQRLPAVYSFRNFYMDEGGLLSYGVDLADVWRRAAAYVDKILKGARPADLPVEQPTKFDMVINLKTARALGLTIPPSVLLRADHVIE